ncbi:HlyD family efflux transporter periplasmic adaptor subunit [Legionella maioricensis]|uniref:HlyD family efflux transporter periplasmic adaptor subunit n=1 Tax=Legionella maioricensis TaxID=2896528 RepID=A0A9X2I7X1_9GAMM|nr:HlyD family efflux transporter periplasmic adaptor subunit [Legionella maioricensis]MCL9682489.1 HlyD family efflux transporter periplasmic adaptor subunit [Legionella maioricensis]MCL9686264.1 HlyD family efflux transporter periplasmic adaptor subunit [Legionella maioricensis]
MNDSEKKPIVVLPKENDPLNKKRQFYLIVMTISFLAIGLLFFLYWVLVARFYEETDNAYVSGNIIPINSQVDGIIIAVKVDDTQFVKAGQPLVQLDPIDSRIAYEQAQANLAQTVRTTHQFFLNNSGLQATVNVHETSLQQTIQDLQRRTNAIGYGAISKEELTHAQDAFKSAQASLAQSRAALLANKALTDNADLEHHPNVLAAAAQLRKAYIDYVRTTIRAPVAGEISKRTAQVGQRITVGTLLMAIIPLEQVWVDANFKEKQLRNMRLGQKATLTADVYGSSVEYHGKIMGFAAGTGSAFSLLPAQNATGNWIKVVQRLPVRIQLDPKELQDHPLRIGLSMEVTVDTHDRNGKFIGETANPPVYKTSIYEQLEKKSNEMIAKIIKENIGKTASLNQNVESSAEKTEKEKSSSKGLSQ